MANPVMEQIAAAIRDKSDAEIVEMTNQAGGVGTVLQYTLASVCHALSPAWTEDCVIGYRITDGADVHEHSIVINSRRARLVPGIDPDARITLRISFPDFQRLLLGILPGDQAVATGRLQIEGDVMFAARLGEIFVA